MTPARVSERSVPGTVLSVSGLRLGLVLLITFAAYLPSVFNGYAMDDRLAAMGIYRGQKHPMIYDLRPVRDYFEASYWKGRTQNLGLYRPVTVWSYAAVHHVFKPRVPDLADREQRETALPQHLLNVLLHVAAVVLVYVLLLGLNVRSGPAAIGALLFGLHAVHSEVVASVIGRADLLAFGLGASATWLLFRAWGRGAALRNVAWIASALLYFLAFASKENAVGWVGFVIVYGLARAWRVPDEGPGGLGPALKRLAALSPVVLVPLVAFLWLRFRVVGGVEVDPVVYMVNPLPHQPAATRLFTAVFIWWTRGLGLTLFPFDLASDYGVAVFPLIHSALDPRFLVSAVLLLGVLTGSLAAARLRPLVFLAATTFLGFSFITSNVPFVVGTIFGERLYYIPSLGAAFLAAWLAERVAPRARLKRIVGVAALVWLAASTLVILERNRVWDSDEVLFLTDVKRQPRSSRLHLCAATILMERGNRTAAREHIETALRLDPENALAWISLADVWFQEGDLAKAERFIRRGLEARHVSQKDDRVMLLSNLARVLALRGREDEARAHLLEALHRFPRYERVWQQLVDLCSTRAARLGLREALERWAAEAPDDPWWPYYRRRLLEAPGSGRK